MYKCIYLIIRKIFAAKVLSTSKALPDIQLSRTIFGLKEIIVFIFCNRLSGHIDFLHYLMLFLIHVLSFIWTFDIRLRMR